jgi:hypothetical protein
MRLGWAVIHLLAPMLFVLVGSVTSVDGQYDTWPNGPPKDPGFFPIAVWLQNPRNAAAYEAQESMYLLACGVARPKSSLISSKRRA